MREMPISAAAEVALDVQLHPGFPQAIDDAAAQADARHRFLRRAWFAAVGETGASTLLAIRADGRVIAALPTVTVGPPALGLRAVPGIYWPFRSFPIAAEARDSELAAFLSAPAARKALGRAWRLGPVIEDDPSVARLLPVARRSGWSVLKRGAGTPFLLDVAEKKKTGPWPRPSTLRNNSKHSKRLAKLGPLGWDYVVGEAWTPEVFDDLTRIERNSWVARKRGADPKFLNLDLRRGWEVMVQDPVLADMLSVGILSVGGEPASFSFGIDAGATRYSIATSYDDRFADHSPGSLTGYRTYCEAVDRGVDLLNLGVGDSGQKSSMGAVPGPRMMDYLFVGNPMLALILSPLWKRSGHKG